ncbi:MAG TPA: M23 family metallopeptidase [Stellaceae bacterium]|nr:M23 family metallopeptidase [Stellaceae bacterium]
MRPVDLVGPVVDAIPPPVPAKKPAPPVIAETTGSTVTDAASDSPAVQPAVEAARIVEALPGDTPYKLLARMGIASDDAQAAAHKLGTVWDPRDLKAGQKAAVLAQSDRLLSLRMVLAPGRDIVVARDDTGNFVAEDQDRPTHEVATLGTGTIHHSLAAAASHAGVPACVLDEMIRAFSFDVDFQREVRENDMFTVLYQRVDDEFGKPTGTGHMVYAEMVLRGTRLRLYRYTPKGGEPGYFNALGENIRKPLLRTPIDGARLSSGFGMRFHPILGYSRMHRGVDFAAPTGTAVYAAGDGVVTRAGQVRGYGNYVEIQHNPQYATAYGHLSAFAKGMQVGEHVHQGDLIAYVGMTGLATGPHLHYEVHYDGMQIDPLSVKMPATTRLAADELGAFQAARTAIDRQLLDMRRGLVAGAEKPASRLASGR